MNSRAESIKCWEWHGGEKATKKLTADSLKTNKITNFKPDSGKFSLEVQKEVGQKLTEFCQKNALVIANTLLQQHKRHSTQGHHQIVNTKIRLIIFFAAKDGEVLYHQRKKNKRTRS